MDETYHEYQLIIGMQHRNDANPISFADQIDVKLNQGWSLVGAPFLVVSYEISHANHDAFFAQAMHKVTYEPDPDIKDF